MQRRTLRVSLVAVLSTLFLSLVPVSRAEYRAKFFASYQISNVSESVDRVEITLKITLHNLTGHEVQGAGVVLYNEAPVASPIGAFGEITLLPASGKVALSQQFSISPVEYARWKQGIQPSLKLLLPDGQGGSSLEHIDLIPAPYPAVEKQ